MEFIWNIFNLALWIISCHNEESGYLQSYMDTITYLYKIQWSSDLPQYWLNMFLIGISKLKQNIRDISFLILWNLWSAITIFSKELMFKSTLLVLVHKAHSLLHHLNWKCNMQNCKLKQNYRIKSPGTSKYKYVSLKTAFTFRNNL